MMQNDYSIVPMKTVHIKQVVKLEQQCFSDPWPEECFHSELENPISIWLVVLLHDSVIGYVGCQSVLGDADMMNIAVELSHRGKGIGAKLINTLITVLRERDVFSLTLEVRPSNQSAIMLYQKLGFLQIGKRVGYYFHPKEDALILRKEWYK